MKALFIFVVSLFFSVSVFAQVDKEDVIYMNDGTVYHGTIIDATYGISYRIKITDGRVMDLDASQIAKITKENKLGGECNPSLHAGYRNYKDKGYLFEMQIHLQVVGGGLRIINGYKINQYAILGIGVGAGGVYIAANGSIINHDSAPYSGFYFPLFVYYSGDIRHEKVTPFYVLEAGYAMAYDPLPGGADGATYVNYNTIKGGPMGSAGFGMRVYSSRRFVFSLSANLDFQYSRTDVYYGVGQYSSYYFPPSDVHSHIILLLPGLKIGLGMVR